MNHHLILLLVPLWPLLLVLTLLHSGTRRIGLRLAPWAAVPALLVALGMDDSTLTLPGTLLGSMLRLDASGRAFLMLSSVLSLAAGLLGHARIGDKASGSGFALYMLLAMSGLLGLALAGDALLFLTATTLLGYSLYGMLVTGSPSASATGRGFVVLLVVSDLALFELLLILAQDAGAVAFDVLRHDLLLAEYPGVVMALLLLGLGAKLGIVGLHLWLGPMFVATTAPMRPMVLGFVLCAGMLGWLRLLPLGEVYWPDAAWLLQFLAVAGLAYALIVGLVQLQLRSLLACGVMAIGAFFLWMLGAVLGEPTLWPVIFIPMHGALLQAGFALAVLFLLPGPLDGSTSVLLRRGFVAAGWLAALTLAAAPLGLVAALGPFDPIKNISLTAIGAVFAMLAGRSLHLQNSAPLTPERVLAVTVVSFAMLLAAISVLFTTSLQGVRAPPLVLLIAGLLGWLGGGPLSRRLPLPRPGYLLGPIDRAITAFAAATMKLMDRWLSRWRKVAKHLLYELRDILALQENSEHLEQCLGRWPVAMLVLLLLGLLLAWWGGYG